MNCLMKFGVRYDFGRIWRELNGDVLVIINPFLA
jgi:hypothetical protein